MEWAFNILPLHMIIFGVLPLMLSYAFTIAFPLMCVIVEKGMSTGNTYALVKHSYGSADQLEKKALI